MQTRPRAIAGPAVAIALSLGLVACSDGDDFNPSASATTAAPARTAPPTSAASDDPFCNFFATFSDRFGRVDVGLADPQQFRTVMEEAASAIRDAQATAPEGIRADVGLMGQAFEQLLNILRQANFDITKVPPASLTVLDNPEYEAASERLETYTRDNCL